MNVNTPKPVSHTPTPWEMHGCAVYQADIWKDGRNIGGEFVFGIRDEDDPTDERLANAQFAVQCVNSHAALVEACQSALAEINQCQAHNYQHPTLEAACEYLRAALALAKEQS